MYNRIRFSLPIIAVVFSVIGLSAAAQDYNMFETQYLKVIPGHDAALEEALTAHNHQFHSGGAFNAEVYWVWNGRRTGQYFWSMGPGTFTDFDGRPSGDPHDSDWSGVMSHLESANNTEYWRLNENLSYAPESSESLPLYRIRWVEVEDNALFRKVQGQITAVAAERSPNRPRSIFRKQFAHRDGRDWAIVTQYANWAELDQPAEGNFQETFKRIHGDDAWDTFIEDASNQFTNAEDEFVMHLPSWGGGSASN